MQDVYAAQGSLSNTIVNPLEYVTNLGQVFYMIINLIMGIGWALVFVMLALGFVQYIMSKGEKTAVENAQKWLTYAVIGGVGLFFVYVIRNLAPRILGSGLNPGGTFIWPNPRLFTTIPNLPKLYALPVWMLVPCNETGNFYIRCFCASLFFLNS